MLVYLPRFIQGVITSYGPGPKLRSQEEVCRRGFYRGMRVQLEGGSRGMVAHYYGVGRFLFPARPGAWLRRLAAASWSRTDGVWRKPDNRSCFKVCWRARWFIDGFRFGGSGTQFVGAKQPGMRA